MNRRKPALFWLLAVILAFAGCAADVPETGSYSAVFDQPQYEWGKYRDVTLRIWAQEGELDRGYMQKALARYEEKTGNTVEIVEIPKESFERETAAALEDKENPPDLILSYGGTNIELLRPDENCYDFTQAPWVDDLTSTSINQTIYHGKVIGLPHWEASISGTLYNKRLFQKYGIEAPKTQDEFLRVCEKLLQNGITPVYLPYKEITMLFYQFPLDSVVEDEKTLEALNTGRLSYAQMPQMWEIVGWYKTMMDRGYFGQDYHDNDWDGMSGAMESEEYAMMLAWDTWLYTDFQGDPSRFGLMPAFMGVPEEGTFEGPNLALLLVNRNGPQVDAAVDFITFMADPYNYNVAFAGLYTAPVFKNQAASISTPQYVEAERLIEKNFRDSVAWLRIRGFSQVDAACIQKYMTGQEGYTLEMCLEEMDALRRKRFE